MDATEPFFIAKGGVDEDAKPSWVERFTADAQAEGCAHIRASERPGLMLLEGWLDVPEEEGEPRWE